MAHLLRGKNPNLPNIMKTDEYLTYHADALVGNSGAQVPEGLRPAVIAKLKGQLATLNSDVRMQQLLQTSRQPTTRAIVKGILALTPDPEEAVKRVAAFLRNPNPEEAMQSLAQVLRNPNYVLEIVERAQVPEKYRIEVIMYLIPLLQKVRTERRLSDLMRMSEHTCTRDMIAKNLEFKRDIIENTAGYAPDSDEYAAIMETRNSIMRAIAQIIGDGFYRLEKGKFTFDERGQINGIKPSEHGRMTACHAALQAGEHLDILDEVEEGGRRRVRKRKTVKKSRKSRVSRRCHRKTRGKA